jgi:uncharacterized membrane-anchored protein YitT (DUF2179 family)
MQNNIYKSPRLFSNIIRNYNPILKNILIDKYNPSLKIVLIEVFYSILFSHHLPLLFNGGGLLGNTDILSFESIPSFFKSYVGKIIFYLIIFYILHFVVLVKIKKIDIKKFM